MSLINNELNQNNDNYFIEINSKSNFEINYEKNYTYLESTFIKKGLDAEIDISEDYNLINEYLNTIFANVNFEPFMTSLYISKNIINNQSKKMRNDTYKDLDNFFQNSKDIIPNFTAFIIKIFKPIGYAFCYIYEQIQKYNIENMQKLSDEINDVIKNKIDILDEYINFVDSKKNWKNESPLKTFINKNKNKYKLPCELILLINYFNNIYTIEINYENLILNENDFLLLTITLLNIDLIFQKVNYIKLNLKNFQFQIDAYYMYFRLEDEALIYTNKYAKFSNLISEKYFNNEFKDENKIDKKYNFNNIFKSNKNDNCIKSDLMNEIISINDIIDKYKNFLSSIIITFLCLQKFINMNKMDLIISENYSYEFNQLFKKNCFLNQSNSFNIINFLQTKTDIKNLNLELNFIDSTTTNKLLEFIYKNKFISDLQLSFFSSEISYSHEAIYKLYSQEKSNEKKEIKFNYIEEPEVYYLNEMIKNFEKNLSILFDIIVSKKNLSKLILNFNIPFALVNNNFYIITILKFIINIIFLLDDSNYSLYNLAIVAPDIIFDKDICPILEDYFQELNIYNSNENLIELNLKIQIYKMVNIKNLISNKIIILNIGNFDLDSFEIFINYLVSYKFSSTSNLKKLSIGLLNSIIIFSDKINSLISKLYCIQISSLLELNLLTNIIIDKKEDYFSLLSNLKYRWISSSNITFNEVSNSIIEENKEFRNNIKYLEFNYEEEIFSNNHKSNKAIQCYWILRYFFRKHFKIKQYQEDKLIFCIFRYLNNETKMSITHN